MTRNQKTTGRTIRNGILAGIVIAALYGAAGCLNVDVKEPLVDLDRGSSSGSSAPVKDPAPGVPDSDLTPQQRQQRELARCQQLLEISEKKYKKLREENEKEKDRLEDQIERLEEQNEDLTKENRKLRKDLRD
ncbi:MAG: hypothetical protein JW810_02750 [Sedimentisphaerales bacterium]|nr:hypothetical protein [Sedimentisphaerales bacterium]